jgi:RHS repeat-associated protein
MWQSLSLCPTSATGASSSSQRDIPFGQTRGTGTIGTNYRFTGQRWQDDARLYYYNTRWYHAGRGRFVQADSIVPGPGNPQALNHYSKIHSTVADRTIFTEETVLYGKERYT